MHEGWLSYTNNHAPTQYFHPELKNMLFNKCAILMLFYDPQE